MQCVSKPINHSTGRYIIAFVNLLLDKYIGKIGIRIEQLETMKFGIDELQQLWLTVSEIARDRGDPLKYFDMIENPVAYFYEKDVEDNYYDITQF